MYRNINRIICRIIPFLQIRLLRFLFPKKTSITKKLLSYEILTGSDLNPFWYHEYMITKVFGHINCNFKALIPRDLLDDLVSYLNEENFLTKNEIKDQFTKESDSKVLKTFRQTSQNIEELISIYSRCWNLDPSKDIVGRLHSFLRKEFSEYFISPICFVNSRAWETKNHRI